MHGSASLFRDGRQACVVCAGEFDLMTLYELSECLRDLPGDVGVVVVDLGGVSFMDCSCLGVLLALASRCESRGIPLVFCCLQPVVRRLFEVLDVERSLRIAADPAGAAQLAATRN